MSNIDLVIETPLSRSSRVRQLEAMFDVPAQEKATLRWKGTIDLDARPWRVGLIVGPSGSGKSTLLRHIFGDQPALTWAGASVIDDFATALSLDQIADICQAVGFNTIPAWLRPHAVLSNGERFRVDLARRLLEMPSPIVVDEFTSVVDRQVAQIGSHAVQKWIRKSEDRSFVAASCHYDIIDWLQPDWILEPSTMSLTWRDLQRRPSLECVIGRIPYNSWRIFAPFHYLTANLNKSASCFGLFVQDRVAAFAGMLHRPHAIVDDIMGCSRLVTLPDFQGLGLAMALIDRIAAAYKTIGKRVHTYPAHPSLIRTFDRSSMWRMMKRPGRMTYSTRISKHSTRPGFGDRPNAVFQYIGPAADRREVQSLGLG